MKRGILNLLACLSFLLLAAEVTLWVRGRHHVETFILRTAPSYEGSPALKRVLLRSGDSLLFTFHVKAVPDVDVSPVIPPWRDDVPVGVFKRAASPGVGRSATRRMTPVEFAQYEEFITLEYRASPFLCWDSAPPTAGAATGVAGAGRLGFSFRSLPTPIVSEEQFPGASRWVHLRVPHAFAACLFAALPAACVVASVRRLATFRRILRGLCPACGYDLRESPEQCPECGRHVPAGEAAAARRGAGPLLVRLLAGKRAAGHELSTAATQNVAPAAGTAGRRLRRSIATVVAVVAVAAFVGINQERPVVTVEALRLRRKLESQLSDVSAEVERLRAAGDSQRADQLEAELKTFRRRADGRQRESSDTPEMHVIGVYEGADPLGKPKAAPMMLSGPYPAALPTRIQHSQGVAVVEVQPTDQPVVLVLCAYEPVKWEVRVAPGARLQRVLLGGYYYQDAVGVPAGVPIERHIHDGMGNDYFFAYDRSNESYPSLARVLQKLTGLHLSTLQGRYAYKHPPFVVGPKNAEWENQRILNDLRPLHVRATEFRKQEAARALRGLRFDAVWRTRGTRHRLDLINSLATFDVTGPIASTLRPGPSGPLVAADNDGRIYTATGRGLGRVEPDRGALVLIPPDPKLPDASIAGGLAFDSRRGRFMLIGNAGTGGVFFYTPGTDTWAFVGPVGRGVDFLSLTYCATADCFYGLTREHDDREPTCIVRFTPQGIAEWRIPVSEGVTRGDGMDSLDPPQIVAAGDLLAIITSLMPDTESPGAPERRRCIVVDPRTNTVVYSGTLAPHDDGLPATAPSGRR